MFATEIDIAFPTCVLYEIGKDWPSISLEDVYERRSPTSKNGWLSWVKKCNTD